MRRLWLQLLAVVSALTGCGQPELSLENGRLVPPAGQGYVVLSMALQSLSVDHASLQLELLGPDSKQTLRADISQDRITGPAGDTPGRLWVLPLKAGRYRFSQGWGEWAVKGSQGKGGSVHFKPDQSFVLAAGEILYLGEIGAQLNFASALTYSDQQERDFYQLKQLGVQDVSQISARVFSTASSGERHV